MNWIETTIPGEGITRYDLIDDAGPEFPLATVHDNGGGGSWLWNATGGPVGWGLTESEAKRFAEEAVLSVQAEWEARHPRPKHPRGPRGRNAYGHNEKPEGGGMKPIRLTLPMPPSGNNRNEGTGRHTHHSAKYERFLGDVMVACTEARVDAIEGPIRSSVTIYYHPSHEPDCDNVLKTVHDALQGWAYPDDALIVAGSYEKRPDKRNPRVEVVIAQIRTVLERETQS